MKIHLTNVNLYPLISFPLFSGGSDHLRANFLSNNGVFCVQVFSVDMDGSNMQVVLNVSVDYPENLAVDWVNNKLYVVEASVNRIDVVDFDGSNRVTLITENLGNPRGVAVDPTVG